MCPCSKIEMYMYESNIIGKLYYVTDKIYPDVSQITQVRCIYHRSIMKTKKISLLYINITEECTHVLPRVSMIIEVARN
jgi:hypothetical protein